jgi:hypothetical protein
MTTTMFDAALSMVATRLPGFDDDHRAELVHSTRELAAERSGPGRAAEVVALAGLALRMRARRTPRLVVRGAVLGAVLVLVALGSLAAGDVLALRVVWAAVVPTVLVALGWFDPRYAVAAAVLWLWRLAAAGLDAVPDVTVTFVRLVAMAAGVLFAICVTRVSLRRLA